MKNNRRVLTLFIPFVLFVIGCFFLFKGLYVDPQKLESVLVGKKVPEFTLQSLYDPNKQFDADILKGQKMLLNVWATWCPTCYAEHQFLNKLSKQGIYIVGMNYKDSRVKAIRWLKDLNDPYKISLFDKDGMLGLDLGVYGAPETFFIDSKGIIQYRHVGNLNDAIWRSKLSKIFNEME
ncbi:periplasmic protein thiol--disulfide oxidoreductase DsbE [Psychromonas sp. CNPT3]|uniref:DsbE family thiol:disulfide interchange protein n=1 Tax=Psychromonas sp. CNPT3 TaxID=314282 RepID=UPI00006E78D2|nr:DsbE family thiol:disulfide interchange protein [Psychromonas sp. CNPT3]AGH82024.1 periplasmic protein thiol--disulfide oxidoreductase DsbE [Psychromonas sp. CNPT3]